MRLLQSAEWMYNAYFRTQFMDKQLSMSGAPVQAYMKKLPLETLLIFPGSISFEDWWHDAEAIAPYAHKELGVIPYGFSLGADDTHAIIKQEALQGPLRFIGHSLGCPHALYQAALMVLDGYDPATISVTGFESPRTGTQTLADILAPVKDVVLTRNSDPGGMADLVLDVPSWAMHPRALTQIGSVPITGNIVVDKDIHAIQAVMVSCELREAQNA